MHDRLQRCPVGSALYRDAAGLCLKILSTIGGGLIDATRYLLLGGGYIGGGLVGVVRHLVVIGDDPGGDLVDAAQYQLVTRDEPVDALPHRVERCIKLLLIERGGCGGQAAYAGGRSARLIGVAALASQAAGMTLRSALWLRRHTTARQRWQLHRCKM
jgi:hypothetical protein